MRYFLEISYLGRNYHGWQTQPRESSIQEEIEKALQTLLKEEVRIHGSSRTDTGVHARQQYAHFDFVKLPISKEDLLWKLNSFLPKCIAIKKLLEMRAECHSRFDAISRKYVYRINLVKDPLELDKSLHFGKELNLEKMRAASKILLENIDYQCFSKVKTNVGNFNCTITQAEWIQKGNHLEFHIKANRFLRGMVRAIVGTLLDIGTEKVTLQEFQAIITSKDRTNAGSAVKAHGLTLEEVNYPDDYFEL